MSGAANCPETPRQKMIGMMYLVLTAMLALNVSADILNGFTLVNKSISQSTKTVQERNQILYSDLRVAAELNPTKVGPWLEEALVVKKRSDSLYNYLENYKYDIVKMADGEGADVNNIVSKDNLDVASEYSLLKGNGEVLEQNIVKFREFLISKVQEDESKVKEFEQMFSTAPSKNNEGEDVPWLNSIFEHMPLVASVTMISKMQSDVRQAEMEVISHLKLQTDAGDFRVNKLGAFVATVSDYVMKGEQYNATIFLSAVDSTKKPLYYVNGKKLDSDVYSFVASTPGVYDYSGEIVLPTNEGDTLHFPFSRSYTVGEPSATVANLDMNVVYRGYENKINVAVAGVADEKLEVQAENATMIKPSGKQKYWICKPTSSGDVVFNIYAKTDGGKKLMGTHNFRTLRLPNPSAFLLYADKNGEEYLHPSTDRVPSRSDLLRSKKIIAQYSDGLLQANFDIVGFTIYAQDATGGVTPVPANNEKITATQMNVIKGKKKGQRIVFEDIRAKGPDGVIRELGAVSVGVN
ncbi:MAG: gliding motility protein GldM [Paludibacteraceae bacterium]|nr:gliding motility protein GldM [Paludibacteraceae bacterium]MBO7724101.1 gliding motility protein GldM [Paludibacteraceae bacterium]